MNPLLGLGAVPLDDLRRRFAPGAQGITEAVLAELRHDRRAGARDLARSLRRRGEREAREGRRLEALFALERDLRRRGARRIAGVDEVGMGPLAGPVVAAAVILPAGIRLLPAGLRLLPAGIRLLPAEVRLSGLRDSKQLSRLARERLDHAIRAVAEAVGIGWCLPDEIDRINIYQAGLLAMRRAVEDLDPAPDRLLVDARTLPAIDVPQRAVVGGDARVGSIAAASIVAKVYRDAWMRRSADRYPGYGFERNSGYGTADHMQALVERGPTPWHRRSFAPVRNADTTRARV